MSKCKKCNNEVSLPNGLCIKCSIEMSSNGKKKPRQYESELQIECIEWFRDKYRNLLLFSIPNGGSRNAIEASRLKKEGVVAGVADLCMLVSNDSYHCLFIELKIGKNKQSDKQIEFEKYCNIHCFSYHTIYNLEDFKLLIKEYLYGTNWCK